VESDEYLFRGKYRIRQTQRDDTSVDYFTLERMNRGSMKRMITGDSEADIITADEIEVTATEFYHRKV
jgi:hypothetical protein